MSEYMNFTKINLINYEEKINKNLNLQFINYILLIDITNNISLKLYVTIIGLHIINILISIVGIHNLPYLCKDIKQFKHLLFLLKDENMKNTTAKISIIWCFIEDFQIPKYYFYKLLILLEVNNIREINFIGYILRDYINQFRD